MGASQLAPRRLNSSTARVLANVRVADDNRHLFCELGKQLVVPLDLRGSA